MMFVVAKEDARKPPFICSQPSVEELRDATVASGDHLVHPESLKFFMSESLIDLRNGIMGAMILGHRGVSIHQLRIEWQEEYDVWL